MMDCSNPDFRLGNMATDLLEYTLDLCNKDSTKTPRFPERMYSSYVTRIVDLALDIVQEVFETNAIRGDSSSRKKRRELIIGKCGAMAKLVFISRKKGWISDKQNTAWMKKINAIYFVVLRWQ